MNTIVKSLGSLGLLCMFVLLSCASKNDTDMQQSQTQVQQFTTSAEAVTKGKNDLLELLKANKESGLNLDIALVEKALPDESISSVEIDFQQFLKADSLESLRDVSGEEKGRITPLYADSKLVTTIITRIDQGAWTVSGIRDQYAEAEISELRNSNPGYSKSAITLYEVPNIDAHIYCLRADERELYFSNYKGMSLAEPMALSELVKIVREDAIEFERQYGEQIKKGKLVK